MFDIVFALNHTLLSTFTYSERVFSGRSMAARPSPGLESALSGSWSVADHPDESHGAARVCDDAWERTPSSW